MGETAADTEREIARIRGDMTAAVQELERRARGTLRTVNRVEQRLASGRTADDLVEQARDNPSLLGVAGVVAAGAVAYGAWALIRGVRERNKPQNRLRRRVQHAGGELSGRLAERVESSRRQLDRARRRNLLLKLDPEDGGYVRVSDARLEPLNKRRGRLPVIKKLVWAGLLSVFLAVGSVVSRRLADRLWHAMVHEDPPTSKATS
jgi:hypothetical protein